MTPAMRTKLVHVICQWQAKERNPYAAGIALQALDRAEAQMAEGDSLARALYDTFNGRLLTKLEKAAGLTVTYGGGGHDIGRPA